MKYWINKDLEVNNVVVLSEDSLMLASCDKEHIEANEKKFLEGGAPEQIFGADNFEKISFASIFKVVSRSTDDDVDIHYKIAKEEDSKFVYFENAESVESFLDIVPSHFSGGMKKKEYQQSLINASLPPLLSLITALGVSAMFINKFRWVTLIIGGLWAIFSVYRLFKRASNPPVITMWSSKNMAGAAWSNIKTAGSLGILAIIIFAVSHRFPDNYGENAFVAHMEQAELSADEVDELIENGGNINRISDYGDRPLDYAIYDGDQRLLLTLLENGADPSLVNLQGNDALDESILTDQVALVETLLSNNKNPLSKNRGKLVLDGRLVKHIGNEPKPEILDLLFESGVSPLEQNEDGLNALQIALTSYTNYESVSMLVQNKVPTTVELEGLSLKEYAIENGQDDIAQLFESRSVSFDRERELTQKIDAFYAKNLNARLNNTSGIAKLILNSEDMADDREELAKELSKSLQYKSLSAWGNQQVTQKYAEVCEESGFVNSADLKTVAESRGKRLQAHSMVSKLILERNRSIYDEDKDVFVVPKEYQKRVNKILGDIDGQFTNLQSVDLQKLNKRCASVYSKLSKKKKPIK